MTSARPVTYEIRAGKNAECELVSVVPTSFGGNATNFVCEGSRKHCEAIKAQLEKMK